MHPASQIDVPISKQLYHCAGGARVVFGISLSFVGFRSPGPELIYYTTEAIRTQQTAEPLAQSSDFRPTVIPSNDVDSLVGKIRARKIRASPPGRNILVVVGTSVPAPELLALDQCV